MAFKFVKCPTKNDRIKQKVDCSIAVLKSKLHKKAVRTTTILFRPPKTGIFEMDYDELCILL